MRTRVFIICALAAGLTAIANQSARAQATLEVPGPANQNQPYVPPRQAPPPPYAPDNGDTIQLLPPQWFKPVPAEPPSPAAASTPPPMNPAPMTAQAAPALPAVFRGCWNGQVNQLDWIRREPGAPKVGFWTPKTYKLCYKQVGDSPFTLTFTETGVEPSAQIVDPHGRVVPISTDGRAHATMRSWLDFAEYKKHSDGFSPTFAVDETTNLNCRIAGDEMLVSADVYGTRDGAPWFRAHWSADFHRFPD